MVTLFAGSLCIPESQLQNGQVGLFCKKTAVFTPCIILFIAIATAAAVCTRICHPACALVEVRRGGSTPVCHLYQVTWYPPAIRATIGMEGRAMAFILDKLLAICRHVQKTSQLWTISQTCSYVMDITYVASWRTMSINQSPGFTVVANNCHANSVLVSHVTMDSERFVASFSIRVDNIGAACGLWTAQFYFTAAFPWIVLKHKTWQDKNRMNKERFTAIASKECFSYGSYVHKRACSRVPRWGRSKIKYITN